MDFKLLKEEANKLWSACFFLIKKAMLIPDLIMKAELSQNTSGITDCLAFFS